MSVCVCLHVCMSVCARVRVCVCHPIERVQEVAVNY